MYREAAALWLSSGTVLRLVLVQRSYPDQAYLRSQPASGLRTRTSASAAQFPRMLCGTQFAAERCSTTQFRALWFSPQSCVDNLTRISKCSADNAQVDLRYSGRAFVQRMLFVIYCFVFPLSFVHFQQNTLAPRSCVSVSLSCVLTSLSIVVRT